jgi:hypothetical protein
VTEAKAQYVAMVAGLRVKAAGGGAAKERATFQTIGPDPKISQKICC